MSRCGQSHKSALLGQKVHLGSVLESELGQKWRYGTLNAYMCMCVVGGTLFSPFVGGLDF